MRLDKQLPQLTDERDESLREESVWDGENRSGQMERYSHLNILTKLR